MGSPESGAGTGEDEVAERIRARLRSVGALWREVCHGPTRTSEESAAARGEPLEIGAKALAVAADDRRVLLVLSAARRMDSKALRSALGARSVRFLSREELLAHTGLLPGSVPPFGRPVLDLELFADESLRALDRLAFNAGSLTRSMVLQRVDWERAAQPSRWVSASLEP